METKDSWENYLSSAQHCYNLSIQNSIKNSPFNVLFGLDQVNSPIFSPQFNRTPLYGDKAYHRLGNQLRKARALAAKNNIEYRKQYTEQYNKKVVPHSFSKGQLVYLYQPELLKFKRGIASPWSGPWILHRVEHNCGLIQNLGSQKTKYVNLQRLRLCDIPVGQWKKQLTELSASNDTVDEKTPAPDQTRQEGMIFDLDNDVVVLNPEAIASHRPIHIKQEDSPEGPLLREDSVL